MLITRHAYKNTNSEAGRPEKIEFDSDDVGRVYAWTNSYGNPSYTLYLEDGTCLFCVDDYGCLNNISAHVTFVTRKKDLF